MKRVSTGCLLLVATPWLIDGCRAESPPPQIIEDSGTLRVDLSPLEIAAPHDAGTDLVPDDAPKSAMDSPPPDAPPPDALPPDAPPPDAPPPDEAPGSDVTEDLHPADRPRDAGRLCLCPRLPSTCSAPTTNTSAFSPSEALLQQLMAVISCAQTTLHIAMYETLWDCVPSALAERLAAAPELRVQIVFDNQACPVIAGRLSCPLSALEGHPRVTLVGDGRSALMHHKFIVADGTRAWVSSANSSQTSYCYDANDAVVVDEAAIVLAFEAEFQRMFRDRAFGPIAPEATVTAGRYSVYFSPRSPTGSPARWFTDMVSAIGTATTSVDFVISAWTRAELSDAMVAARSRGVTVRGIVAPEYINDVPARALRSAGIAVRVGDVHSKLLIVDGQTVITGSANWSAAAWANNENSLWIRDASAGSVYGVFFERQFMAARVPTGM